ncbi:hypothetical protein [Endozoicomonas sp.]|uniref:hypothetical protein n=1 Tax=Endozoicomonas sp. TaxID=1892382 RepID=UPI002887BBA3|nr:hypothetical protein [Endozoicomonas sp.]
MPSALAQILGSGNLTDLTQTKKPPKLAAKLLVNGNGQPINGTLLLNRSPAKVEATPYTARGVSAVSNGVNAIPETPPPPPPPPAFVPPPPASGSPVATMPKKTWNQGGNKNKQSTAALKMQEKMAKQAKNKSTSAQGDLLAQINAKIKNNATEPVDAVQIQSTESTPVTFKTASEYINDGAWDHYKDQLTKKVIAASGIKGNNTHLNSLMKQHANHAGKEGNHDAVRSDIDAEGEKKNPGNIQKSKYEAYILGRDQKQNLLNDFNQNINEFLNQYLTTLSTTAKKHGKNIQELMSKWFEISTLAKAPAEFFAENTELTGQLKKTGCQVQWLKQQDMTEEFIDGLINYDNAPEKIATHINKIFSREEKALDNKKYEIQKAQEKHKSKLSKLLGKK